MFVRLSKYQALQNELTKALLKIIGKDIDIQTLRDELKASQEASNMWRRGSLHSTQVEMELSTLKSRISQLGGEAFLRGEVAHPYIRAELSEAKLKRNQGNVEVRGFTEEQLRSLLQLVHPDKHGGKDSAVRMTQLINQLRG